MIAHIPDPIRLPIEVAPEIAKLLPTWRISVEVSQRYSTPYVELVAIANPEEHDQGWEPVGFQLYYASGYGWQIETFDNQKAQVPADHHYPASVEDIVETATSLLDSKWNDDGLQFARLLSEIAANFDPTWSNSLLAEAMDLTETQLASLFNRAQLAWEKAKREK